MDEQQARELGTLLRTRREELGYSLRKLAELSGIPNNTILHFEQGQIGAPAPDKVARVAAALDLRLADVYATAGWAVPEDLPHMRPYLRTKYNDLTPEDVDAFAKRVTEHGGVVHSGPANREGGRAVYVSDPDHYQIEFFYAP